MRCTEAAGHMRTSPFMPCSDAGKTILLASIVELLPRPGPLAATYGRPLSSGLTARNAGYGPIELRSGTMPRLDV